VQQTTRKLTIVTSLCGTAHPDSTNYINEQRQTVLLPCRSQRTTSPCLQVCANAAVTPSASKPATTSDFKFIIFYSREFNPTPHRIGYLIPWFFIRQAQTIAGMAKPSPQFARAPALVALGAAIRRERSGRGLSQELLAVDAGLDRSYMGGVERGEHNLSVMNLLKIAVALKLSPSQLLECADL
jgi:hypothetical protein